MEQFSINLFFHRFWQEHIPAISPNIPCITNGLRNELP